MSGDWKGGHGRVTGSYVAGVQFSYIKGQAPFLRRAAFSFSNYFPGNNTFVASNLR